MRTTLTLDDDIAAALRERARTLNRTFRQVVNEALRRGLSPTANEDLPPYKLIPNRSGLVSGIDPLRLSQLSDELEAEAFPRATAE